MCDISIIIVNYNSGSYIKNCVKSIFDNIDIKYEVIVWDNNSTDNSLALLEDAYKGNASLKIIRSANNLGFAKANNCASNNAKGTIYHFLNPDTLINKQLNEDYKAIINSTNEAVYVTSLRDEFSISMQTNFALPLIFNYLKKIFFKNGVKYWTIGASIIMSAITFEKIGKWADNYFMYTEDMDMFYCIHKNKIPIIYLPTDIIHIGKVSSENKWNKYQRALQIEKSLKIFYLKYGIIYQYYLIRPMQFIYMVFKNRSELGVSFKVFIKLFYK